jgi:hypothetical protein
MISTDDVQAYSDQPSPSPFPLLFQLTMFVTLNYNSVTLLRLNFLQLATTRSLLLHHNITYNSVTLLRLHFLQLATTRSPAPTSQLHLQQRHLAQAAFPPACNNKVACSYITTSPSLHLSQSPLHPAHRHRHGPWFHKVAEHFTLCLVQPGRPPHTLFPIVMAPGSTKWLSVSHFAWHNLAALPISVPHRYGPWFHKVAEPFTLCLAQPGRPPHLFFITSPGSTKWPTFHTLPGTSWTPSLLHVHNMSSSIPHPHWSSSSSPPPPSRPCPDRPSRLFLAAAVTFYNLSSV